MPVFFRTSHDRSCDFFRLSDWPSLALDFKAVTGPPCSDGAFYCEFPWLQHLGAKNRRITGVFCRAPVRLHPPWLRHGVAVGRCAPPNAHLPKQRSCCSTYPANLFCLFVGMRLLLRGVPLRRKALDGRVGGVPSNSGACVRIPSFVMPRCANTCAGSAVNWGCDRVLKRGISAGMQTDFIITL
uniref:Putative g-beta-repeat protein n=1 Tax=Ixodes ricinus TaxID=34613 RepID=A0A0K8R8Y4_IXORI